MGASVAEGSGGARHAGAAAKVAQTTQLRQDAPYLVGAAPPPPPSEHAPRTSTTPLATPSEPPLFFGDQRPDTSRTPSSAPWEPGSTPAVPPRDDGTAPLRELPPDPGSAPVTADALPAFPPSTAACEEFDAVWTSLATQLQLGKRAIGTVSMLVRKGQLPCDAALLHSRAQALLDLGPALLRQPPDSNLPNHLANHHNRLSALLQRRRRGWGAAVAAAAAAPAAPSGPPRVFRPRLLLTEYPGQLLRLSSQPLARSLKRLLRLLPDVDPTLLVGTVAGDLHKLGPELLAYKFTELSYVFRAVFGTDVPQRLFSYLTADATEQRARRRARERTQLQQQQVWEQQQQHGPENRAGAPAGVQQQQEGAPAERPRAPPPLVARASPTEPGTEAATAVAVDSAALSPLQLQERLECLSSALGKEVAFAVLRSHPALLDLDPRVVADRCEALAHLLGRGREPAPPGQRLGEEEPATVQARQREALEDNEGPDAWGQESRSEVPAGQDDSSATQAMDAFWEVVEHRGDVLLVPPQQLEANMDALEQGLGWSRNDVRDLAVSEPLALLLDWREVVARLSRLEGSALLGAAVGGRPHWQQELREGKVPLLALLLRRSPEALDRLDYLLRNRRDRPGAPLSRVLSETKADFTRLSPGYRRWRVQGPVPVPVPEPAWALESVLERPTGFAGRAGARRATGEVLGPERGSRAHGMAPAENGGREGREEVVEEEEVEVFLGKAERALISDGPAARTSRVLGARRAAVGVLELGGGRRGASVAEGQGQGKRPPREIVAEEQEEGVEVTAAVGEAARGSVLERKLAQRGGARGAVVGVSEPGASGLASEVALAAGSRDEGGRQARGNEANEAKVTARRKVERKPVPRRPTAASGEAAPVGEASGLSGSKQADGVASVAVAEDGGAGEHRESEVQEKNEEELTEQEVGRAASERAVVRDSKAGVGRMAADAPRSQGGSRVHGSASVATAGGVVVDEEWGSAGSNEGEVGRVGDGRGVQAALESELDMGSGSSDNGSGSRMSSGGDTGKESSSSDVSVRGLATPGDGVGQSGWQGSSRVVGGGVLLGRALAPVPAEGAVRPLQREAWPSGETQDGGGRRYRRDSAGASAGDGTTSDGSRDSDARRYSGSTASGARGRGRGEQTSPMGRGGRGVQDRGGGRAGRGRGAAVGGQAAAAAAARAAAMHTASLLLGRRRAGEGEGGAGGAAADFGDDEDDPGLVVLED